MRSIRQTTAMEFDISYTSKEITPWGGMVFLKQMLQKIGFRELIERNEDLPQSGSNRGYQTATIIEGFITSIWCGANKFLHTEVTRHDTALAKYLIGKIRPGKIPTSVFSASLRRRKIMLSASISTLGFLIISSLIILHWISTPR